MRIVTLVPTLIICASAASAVDLPQGFTLGGYVAVNGSMSQLDARGAVSNSGPVITHSPGSADTTNAFIGAAALGLVAPGASPAGAHEGVTAGFTVDAELRLGYAFSPKVRSILELRFDNNYSNDISLQQAKLEMDISDRTTLIAGKMEGLFGLESPNRDERWRINQGLTTYLSGSEIQGGVVSYRLTEGSSLKVGLSNGLGLGAYRDDTNVNSNGRLAVLAKGVMDMTDVATINVEAGYDPHSYDWGVSNNIQDWADVFQAGVNATVQLKRSYEPLKVGLELIYRRTAASDPSLTGGEAFDTVGGMIMANHRIDASFPCSVTMSLSKVVEGVGWADSPRNKQALNEVSLALLTKPKLEGFEALGANIEATYRFEEGHGADGVDGSIWGVYVQLIAVLP